MMYSHVEKLFVWFEVSIKVSSVIWFVCSWSLSTNCVDLLERGRDCWRKVEVKDFGKTHMKLNDKSSMLVCAHVQNPVKYIIDQYAGKGTKSISFRKLSSKFWRLLKRTKLSSRIRAFKVLKKLNFKDDQSFDWKLSVELSCMGSFKACKGNKLIITGYVCK